jgi:hypothetical protein
MSLRDGGFPSKQSPITRGDIVPVGDCFATCARNDMQGDALREVQSPALRCTVLRTARRKCRYGDGSQTALMPSILDKAFKGEL